MSLFKDALEQKNMGRPPIWLMRQAGRYHAHYQNLRKQHSFVELCKTPAVACEATMGPIRDFDFDAAILFSDLLFPLEAMGMGLRYEEGPKLDWHLQSREDLNRLGGGKTLAKEMDFQGEAMKKIRAELPAEKGLLGFVGGPVTLFCYAVQGSHQGDMAPSLAGLRDGRYEGFVEKLVDLLAENMAIQVRGGADTIAVLDTCAGEFDPETYSRVIVPSLAVVLERFKKLQPDIPVTYYSKKTGPDHWKSLVDLPISAIGVDWHHDLAEVLDQWSERWAIQGNIDPNWMFFSPAELEHRLRSVWDRVKELPAVKRQGWVCGLGHGVLPKTPEENVRLFVKTSREIFGHE